MGAEFLFRKMKSSRNVMHGNTHTGAATLYRAMVKVADSALHVFHRNEKEPKALRKVGLCGKGWVPGGWGREQSRAEAGRQATHTLEQLPGWNADVDGAQSRAIPGRGNFAQGARPG